MPSEQNHINQYKHNKKFLTEGINNPDEYPDWFVTVTFYCGVHMIEALLAKEIRQHSFNHIDRGDKMRRLQKYLSFRTAYGILYDLSMQARYKCIEIRERELYDAQTALDTICTAYGKV
ncbi:MAG TPA: hypothetical protein DEP23_06675 [Ruminococcaceae bacterium]|jgi:hypothetical protein|nr:hypothetical protein [Oscillospiraceae bacterium]